MSAEIRAEETGVMNHESVLSRIWRIVYPLLIYFLLDVLIVFAVQYLALPYAAANPESFLALNTPAIGSVIFLIVSIIVCWRIYRRDAVGHTVWIYHSPQYFLLLALIGILASHGLSALISLAAQGGMISTYQEIEENVFQASPVLVILQTIVLAPVSEELLFRGIIFRRLGNYIPGFWGPALISSAIFGIYHLNLAQGIFAFLFGLLICAVYDRVQNLWAAIALHVGGNLVSVVLVYLRFQYPQPWMYILFMILALVGAAALYYFLIRPLKSRAQP